MKKIKVFNSKRVLSYLALSIFVLLSVMFLNQKNIYAKNTVENRTGYKKLVGYKVDKQTEDKKHVQEDKRLGGYNWGKFGARYYYSQMRPEEKNLYDNLYNRCMQLLCNENLNCQEEKKYDKYSTPDVSYSNNISDNDLENLITCFKLENPQFYFLGDSYFYGTGNNKHVSLEVYRRYASGKNRYAESEHIKNKLESWLGYVNKNSTSMQKLRRIEKVVCENTEYDLNSQMNQSAASVLLYGKSVCTGYAKTCTMLSNAVGNEAVCVISNTHAWSRVKIAKKWYNMDPTWDDNGSSSPKTNFFLVNEQNTKVFDRDKEHELYSLFRGEIKAPETKNDFMKPIYSSYYYFGKYEDLRNSFGNIKSDGTVDGVYLDHFMRNGMKEARQASDIFNVEYYRSHNEDLNKAFGNDLEKYYEHFAEFGYEEKRQATEPEQIQDEEYLSLYDGVDYSSVYNYNYYINKYPDVKKAYGGNVRKTLEHFVHCGMKEGRQGNETFDVHAYRRAYPDLRMAFKNDWVKYYEHYIFNGVYENRQTNNCDKMVDPITKLDGKDYAPVYDYEYYISHNPDVAKAHPDDDYAVLYHFVHCGMKEGRQGNETFDVHAYRRAYPDLRMAFKNDLVKYYDHYLKNGQYEKRQTNNCDKMVDPITKLDGKDYAPVYDYEYYISHNPDVAKAYPDDDYAVLYHFVHCGMKEGRQGNATFNLNEYKQNNPDLVQKFGNDNQEYYKYYIEYGHNNVQMAS
ncbi:Transglutaminase-like superfamily protein [Lachnospiraceae bacterium C7]|nr:Transglutaminase-like superfamily protein [Lachnospiraceae bacterium C7]